MNGLIPPLTMELNVDTLQWCPKPFPKHYPSKVRTYNMTNDRYLLKTCWAGPYVKMSLWLDPVCPEVYEPIARKMESTGRTLKNIYNHFGTHDVLFAADLNPKLNTDLTLVQVTKYAAASFKIDTPFDLNEPGHEEKSCIYAVPTNNDVEFYNPMYEKSRNVSSLSGHAPDGVTIHSRLMSDDFCAGDTATLRDTLSRVPSEMNQRMYKAYMKMRDDYERLRALYRGNAAIPLSAFLPQPQQSAQRTTETTAASAVVVVDPRPAEESQAQTNGHEVLDSNPVENNVAQRETPLQFVNTEFPPLDLLPAD